MVHLNNKVPYLQGSEYLTHNANTLHIWDHGIILTSYVKVLPTLQIKYATLRAESRTVTPGFRDGCCSNDAWGILFGKGKVGPTQCSQAHSSVLFKKDGSQCSRMIKSVILLWQNCCTLTTTPISMKFITGNIICPPAHLMKMIILTTPNSLS